MKLCLLDGAIGTELARRGVPLLPPAWSAHALDVAPDLVAAIHRDYAAAGAHVHTADTFRTGRRAVGERWEALTRRAVALAREGLAGVPGGPRRVAGSLAPVEDCYRPDLSPRDAARPEHRERARVLAETGVDLILCETFPDWREAIVAVQEAARTGVETWAALTAGPDASLMTPAEMRDGARACVEAGARAVLVNCTPAVRTRPYVEALSGLGVPFGAYANAGDPADHLGWDEPAAGAAAAYARIASAWIEAGATIIGGCCGTGPAHVAALARQAPLGSRSSTGFAGERR